MGLAGAVLALSAAACGWGTPAASLPTSDAPFRLYIEASGIGAADIGIPPSAAFTELNSAFGEPDVDSGWIDPDSPLYGSCPGESLRAVGWGSLYLYFVADQPLIGSSEDGSGRLYSFSYGYDFSRNEGATDPRELDLTTTAGIGIGSTRAALQLAYGADLLEEYDGDADVWTWSISGGASRGLRGLLSGPDDEATVGLIELEPGCELN